MVLQACLDACMSLTSVVRVRAPAQIPLEVTRHYLLRSGFHADDPRLLKLISLATQKFLEDVCTDCLQLCKQQQPGGTKADKKAAAEKRVAAAEAGAAGAQSGTAAVPAKNDKRLTLTNKVLSKVLSEVRWKGVDCQVTR